MTHIEVIHTYTRAEALADGVLIDITEAAKAHRFRHHFAITSTAYAELVSEYCRGSNTSEAERLGDILDMLYLTIVTGPRGLNRLTMNFGTVDAEGVSHRVDVTAHCHPGDDGEPVMTLMLPGEE